jgi:hypothetical protein
MKKRSAYFQIRAPIVMGEIAWQFYGARLGRYQVLMHGAIRPDSYSELIVPVVVFQIGICDRYPNADEVFLVVDIFDYHAAELRKARMEKLLDGGLQEYWAVDLLDGGLTTHRVSAGGLVRATYGFDAHVSPASLPDIEVDLTELAEWIYSPSAGTRM